MLYLGGSCGCEGHNGAFSDLGDDSAYPTIFGAEVVPPVGDAVRLVDDDEPGAGTAVSRRGDDE